MTERVDVCMKAKAIEILEHHCHVLGIVPNIYTCGFILTQPSQVFVTIITSQIRIVYLREVT